MSRGIKENETRKKRQYREENKYACLNDAAHLSLHALDKKHENGKDARVLYKTVPVDNGRRFCRQNDRDISGTGFAGDPVAHHR